MNERAAWDLVVVGSTVLTFEPGAEPIVNGAVVRQDDEDTGARPGRLVRGRR